MVDMKGWRSLLYGTGLYEVDTGFKTVLKSYGVDTGILSLYSKRVSTELLPLIEYIDGVDGYWEHQWSLGGDYLGEVFIPPQLRRELEHDLTHYRLISRAVYDGDWHRHMAMLYLIGDAGYECILTVTTQTSHALHKYAGEYEDVAKRLAGLSKPIEFGGTWYTEIHAGSDLGAIETYAEHIDEKVAKLYGIKYFTSNVGLGDWVLTLARSGGEGLKGLSLYLLPKKVEGRINYRLIRLKDKVGTIVVPTGEVELDGSIAYRIAGEREAIYIALENLTISRLANSVGAVGIARWALAEAALYSLERKAFGKRLIEHPLFKYDLARLDMATYASLALAWRAVDSWRMSEKEKPPYSERYLETRILTHLAKAYTAKKAIEATGEAMELLGGRGFLREFTVERLHREALVTSIWEGTTNIHIHDFYEAVSRRGGLDILKNLLIPAEDREIPKSILEEAEALVKRVEELVSMREPVDYYHKQLFFKLAETLSVIEALKTIDKHPDPGRLGESIVFAYRGVDSEPLGYLDIFT